MKRFVWIAGALLLMMTGCRQESDYVLSYAFDDEMAFRQADSSFAGKFDVFWHGMNANYALWDFEKANGLDWDQVYETYRPRFAALDAVDTLVSDKQLQDLMNEVIKPLHDGHLAIQMLNHATGKRVITGPGSLRVMEERKDEYMSVANATPSLTYYSNAGELLESRQASSNTFFPAVSAAMSTLMAQINALEAKPERTPQEEELLTLYQMIHNEIRDVLNGIILGGSQKEAMEKFNEIAFRYEYLHIPGLEPIDKTLNEYAFTIKYALFKGNIAYLTIDSFKLSAFLNPMYTRELMGTPSPSTQAIIDDIKATWQAWFDAIQAHHKAGDLGGVIIDIRSNGGGYLDDYRYVLGALLPSGGYYVTDARFKRGTGRYDYSPVMPQYLPTLDEEHVTVTEPIVALCNCASVSMAEQTSLGVKILPNGTLVGTRSWGGLSALSGSDSYSNDYAGYVGVMDKTPVFCYIPREVAITKEGQILEGYGVEPDIEVALDIAAWMNGNGPDTQLDRALQFIREGR